MFKKLCILQRILLGFGVVLLVFILSGTITIQNLSQIESQANLISNIYIESIVSVSDIRTELARIRIRQTRLLHAHDETAKAETMALIEKGLAGIEQNMRTYDALPEISSDTEQKEWASFTKGFTEFKALMKTYMGMLDTGRYDDAVAYDNDVIRIAFNKLASAADIVEKENAAGARQAAAQCVELSNHAHTLSILSLIVASCISALAAIMTARAIARPVRDLTAAAQRIAEGDYAHKTSNEHLYTGELIPLLSAIRSMVRTIISALHDAGEQSQQAKNEAELARRATESAEVAKQEAEGKSRMIMEAVGELQNVMERLASSSEELSAQIEQSSRGTEEQARRVSETATAIEEMNATVLEVAKNAEATATQADRARTEAEQGEGIVNASVKEMAATAEGARELKATMAQLDKQAADIGRIMSVISDIADQTNLLALNAAIEAARAGDAGRGFAVVADEVRKLAEKTMNATTEVGEAIRNIQSGTAESTGAVDNVVQRIDGVMSNAQQSGEALGRIVGAIRIANEQVTSIATASSQQSSASDEIARAIEDINRISSETAEAMHQSSLAVSELAAQAQHLETLVTRLRADNE